MKASTAPTDIHLLETLNIFGIRADYMRQFKEYLEEEGLPGNEERIEFILPVVKNLQGKKLTSVRIQEGKDFKLHGPKPTLDSPPTDCCGIRWRSTGIPRFRPSRARA